MNQPNQNARINTFSTATNSEEKAIDEQTADDVGMVVSASGGRVYFSFLQPVTGFSCDAETADTLAAILEAKARQARVQGG